MNTNFELSLLFEQNWEDKPPILIECNFKDKVSDIIEKYRNKANDYYENRKFIFNAKNLEPSYSVAEVGLLDNSFIYVISTGDLK